MKKGIWILALSMTFPGMAMILPGSTLDAMVKFFELTKSEAGYIGSSYFFGGLLGMLVTSAMMSRMGARRTLATCCFISGISLSAMPFAKTYPILLLAFFILGFAISVLITLPGVVVSALSGKNSAGPMNTVYGFFALGVVIEPQVAGWMLTKGMPWWAPYLFPAVISVMTALIALLMRGFPEPPLQKALSFGIVRDIWNDNHIALSIGVLGPLLYCTSEVTLSFWTAKFLLDTFPESETIYRANTILTLFWAGLFGGRLAYSRLLSHINPAKYLITVSFLAAITTGIAPYLGVHWGVEACVILAGIWLSAMYPTLTSYSGRLKPEHSGAAFSLMALGGQVGATLLPTIVGPIAQHGSFSFAMSLVAMPLLLISLFLLIVSNPRWFAGR